MGWTLAREMGRLDVGQSVMIGERAVLAVEAIEGTDRAIERAGELCSRRGFVVVKVAKPGQDRRFDVPTVGKQTIETMHQAGARVLAIEAGQTILLDEVETIALADATASRSRPFEFRLTPERGHLSWAAISREFESPSRAEQVDLPGRLHPIPLDRWQPLQACYNEVPSSLWTGYN